MIIDSTRRGIVLIPPDLVQEFLARDHAFRILHEELQYFELLCGHGDRLTRTCNLHLSEIDTHIAEALRCVGGLPGRTTYGCPYPRQKLARAEWLRHIVVSTHFEQQYLVDYIAGRAKNNNGKARCPVLDLPADILARHFGKTQVKHDRRGRGTAKST